MAAMATLQWAAPVDDSLWERMKHTAGVLYQRSGAYLTGQYQYVFHNQTGWTVKLHLTDDLAQDGITGEVATAQGYFLTLPAGSHSVEIPMKSSLVTITGGFFHQAKGCYEIFWDRRRFAWSPRVSIAVQQRHSNDVNEFRSDVTPGAPLMVVQQAYEEFAIFTPKQGPTQAKEQGLQIAYSLEEGQWKSAVVSEVLPGGLLQLEDGASRWTLRPTEQPTLVPCGPVEAAQLEEGGQVAGVTAGAEEPPIPTEEAAAPQSTSTSDSGETYMPGQSLQVYSASKDAWVKAEVTKVLADGSVTLQCAACKSLKTICPEDQAKVLKTM